MENPRVSLSPTLPNCADTSSRKLHSRRTRKKHSAADIVTYVRESRTPVTERCQDYPAPPPLIFIILTLLGVSCQWISSSFPSSSPAGGRGERGARERVSVDLPVRQLSRDCRACRPNSVAPRRNGDWDPSLIAIFRWDAPSRSMATKFRGCKVL